MARGPVAAQWQRPDPEAETAFLGLLRHHPDPAPLFFRADDVGAPGANFARMAGLFRRHRVPLALAVVPCWLTRDRWRALREACGDGLWTWHQHGWRHVNHEPHGKKQEFGPARPDADKARDMARGRERLAGIMDRAFTPVFTPPWNRMDAGALAAARELGYAAVSRHVGEREALAEGLRDIPVAVDLHTGREADPARAWRTLGAALQAGLDAEPGGAPCGIMLHHQRMNHAAFAFLDRLLAKVSARGLKVLHLAGELGR
jgi:hypothetical protein